VPNPGLLEDAYHVPTLRTDPLPDERELVERAKTEPAAFGELYRRYLPRVHAYAWRRTGSRDAAEDITASVFEAALRGLPRYRWHPGGFAPWLFRIAANQVVDHHRREGRGTTDRGQRAMALMADPGIGGRVDEGDAALLARDDAEEVRAALAGLRPRYQRAIDLRYLTGLDPTEAAKAMGLAKPAFAVVLSRALKALRRALEAQHLEAQHLESQRLDNQQLDNRQFEATDEEVSRR
jgi:RNA polymerase sigma-70 factor (ECF subfamily)